MSPSKFDPMATLPLRSAERRIYWRFHLPVSVLAEATWRGQQLALATDPDYENISAVGTSLALARGPRPPVGEEVEIWLPLAPPKAGQAERPSEPARRTESRPFGTRLFAFCRGRVVRHEGANRFAVYFEDVDFFSEQPTRPNAEARPHA